jgi:hypothetical protein
MKVFSMRGVPLYWLELKHWITDLLRDVSTQMEHNAVGEGGGGGRGREVEKGISMYLFSR